MEKEALVLLPGTLCDEKLWKHQLEHLTDVSNPIVCVLNKEATIEEMAERVLDEAPHRFALAGLSLGGIVAMEIIRQQPERVTRLGLLDSNPTRPRPEQRKSWAELRAMVEAGHFQQVVQQRLLPNLIHPSRQGDHMLVSTIMDMAETIGPNYYLKQLHAVALRSDYREGLRDITVPTLLLVGKDDTVCPPYLHEEMSALIKKSQLVVVDECGHLSTLEQPEAVTDALQNWLRRKCHA
ncbi:alpha/beta fold hydrolase [Fictibacillus phosphorivorans]|uniref:alpha/beta fold hydrolase n=1 Tax=Fictibacillus phosphorivorans TaxID=1221500 RepID=UPI0011A08EC5|nr:alpha/beta fold hydrolase [Fictibacillus phosphorivorans]